ncbi:MAG: hypothetical protein GKR86_00210 [Ilumatobacter sp.]|nr:hypothetical protein [Ilumatobacter sp.]
MREECTDCLTALYLYGMLKNRVSIRRAPSEIIVLLWFGVITGKGAKIEAHTIASTELNSWLDKMKYIIMDDDEGCSMQEVLVPRMIVGGPLEGGKICCLNIEPCYYDVEYE